MASRWSGAFSSAVLLCFWSSFSIRDRRARDRMVSRLLSPQVRPYLILVIVAGLLAAADAGNDRFLTLATAYSTFQSFSTFGLVALGLGLTMLIGEFDLSVAGVFGLAGCVAVLTGETNPWLG